MKQFHGSNRLGAMARRRRRPGRPRELHDPVQVTVKIERRALGVLQALADVSGQSVSSLLRDVVHDAAEVEEAIRAEEPADVRKERLRRLEEARQERELRLTARLAARDAHRATAKEREAARLRRGGKS